LCHAEGECGTVYALNMCISSEIGYGTKKKTLLYLRRIEEVPNLQNFIEVRRSVAVYM
jgi:hypothetical protein